MRNGFSKIALAAGVGIALAFTLSCSDDDDRSEPSYDYCITADNNCLTGPFTASTCQGQLSNSCPNGSNPSSSSSNSTTGKSSSSGGNVSNSSSSAGNRGSSSSTGKSSSSIGKSSSSGGISSSSDEEYAYCVFMGLCIPGPFSADDGCPGELSNTCPSAPNSSSSNANCNLEIIDNDDSIEFIFNGEMDEDIFDMCIDISENEYDLKDCYCAYSRF